VTGATLALLARRRSAAIRSSEPWFHLSGGSSQFVARLPNPVGSGCEGENAGMATQQEPQTLVGSGLARLEASAF
jgi:hypothetical protein